MLKATPIVVAPGVSAGCFPSDNYELRQNGSMARVLWCLFACFVGKTPEVLTTKNTNYTKGGPAFGERINANTSILLAAKERRERIELQGLFFAILAFFRG